jgi:hypothetical protein
MESSMPVQLEIHDGNPWWASPDIWVVPGDDPNGPIGSPVAGTPAYVWARVTNNGETAVSDATVRFYWANPSVGVDRTTANLIGTAFVALAGGQSDEVLCLTQWVPVFVNGGHECLVAEAFHPSLDPLPATTDFNVPTDRHVAQLNVSVAMALRNQFHLAFEVHNPSRKDREFAITARQGSLGELQLDWIHKIPNLPAERQATTLGFLREPCPNPDQIVAARVPKIGIKVGPQGRSGLTLAGVLQSPGAAVIHIEQHADADNHLVGGLSVVVISH